MAITSATVFDALSSELPSHPEVVKKVKGVFQYIITKDGKEASAYVADLKNGAGSVKAGKVEKADCTITISDDDFVKLFTGKANPQQMFMQGKLKIKGNMSYAMKLQELQKLRPKSGPLAAAAAASSLECAPVFKMMQDELPSHPEVVKKVQGVYQYIITKDGKEAGAYVADLKNGAGSVVEGKVAKADCTITISDDDFVKLFSGKANPQQMFMQGKLKIKGNMSYAMKLQELMKLKPKSKL
eukprot:CAMPEP_0117049904 /NCGR_PEP_ID=MMETSP0472-20121206/34455_1 /TAXON_ID=693140 ORGANISM="Tiarina fusus, Strain LIS" /NCGR_SAMPLE_ID=MMETSP0472 /ASSEMBLY_ACC=CAM_ASM_000603 /LENGTH=241 /DNA_ID=CAMNT_0004763481 /DNA_START=9 /DNA_END=734 /DNA_ORIENTATION=+